MAEAVVLHRGAYRDSVTLMQVSARLAAAPGVDAALVAMATDLNRGLLVELGFAEPADARPSDLLVAVRATDDAAVAQALDQASALLTEVGPPTGADRREPAPRSLRLAARALDGATVALISVPGAHAFVEAMDALAAGLHVVVFSDNVPVAEELALKAEAARRGLLAMGPDCGTVILSGVGLGFANAVRPGPVGLVAASGTGAQQVCALLDHAGVGVRHVLGVGGHDLSAAVGGAAALPSLDRLDADPAVEVIGLVAKAAAPEVLERISAHAAALATPVVTVAADQPDDDLTAGAVRLAAAAGVAAASFPSWPGRPGRRSSGTLRGLYSGGTLCQEAAQIVAPALGAVATNLHGPIDPATTGHLLVDLGADEMTRGRPHPMIDQLLRLRRLAADAADPATAVVLLDVVLGHGAHPDPAAELAPAIADATDGQGVAVVVALVGTRDDPQDLDHQARTLAGAGAHVHLSNAEAARHAADLARRGSGP